MNKTSIPYADYSWNLWTGCLHNCSYCYAKPIATRFGRAKKNGAFYIQEESETPSGKIYVADTDSPPFPMDFAPTFYPKREGDPYSLRGKGKVIFVNDMADTFGDWVPDFWLVKLYALMALCAEQTFLILTKDPARAAEWLNNEQNVFFVKEQFHDYTLGEGRFDWPLKNVLIGTTVENQAAADKRIPELLKTPGRHWVSVEPMLGPVDLSQFLSCRRTFHLSASVDGMLANRHFDWLTGDDGRALTRTEAESELRELSARGVRKIPCSSECAGFSDQTGCPGHPETRLDWVVCGGQTGPKRTADPVLIDVRYIKNQCVAAGVPFFLKQMWGEKMPELDGQVWDQSPEVPQ